jgi:hypothetical protein
VIAGTADYSGSEVAHNGGGGDGHRRGTSHPNQTRGSFAKYRGLYVNIWIATINRDPK